MHSLYISKDGIQCLGERLTDKIRRISEYCPFGVTGREHQSIGLAPGYHTFPVLRMPAAIKRQQLSGTGVSSNQFTQCALTTSRQKWCVFQSQRRDATALLTGKSDIEYARLGLPLTELLKLQFCSGRVESNTRFQLSLRLKKLDTGTTTADVGFHD